MLEPTEKEPARIRTRRRSVNARERLAARRRPRHGWMFLRISTGWTAV
jgi:hypothetical protein